MTADQDYYARLGLSREATPEEIKKAYRKAAMQFHPDRNPGDKESEEQFKACAEAYEVLSDPEKRRLYDTYGKEGLEGRGIHTGFGGFEDIFSHFGDIFSDIFGGESPFGYGSRRRKARDLQVEVQVTFEEAASGVRKEVSVPRSVPCEDCKGRGYPPDSPPTTCPQCRGRGKVLHQQGFFTLASGCPVCGGTGQVVSKPCRSCNGRAVVSKRESVSIDVPPGIDSGNRLVMRGKGDEGGESWVPGDLYVRVFVKEHELLKREGADLHAEVPVSMFDAALGTEVSLDVLGDKVAVKIPEGSQPGTVFTFRRKGFPRLQEPGRGDLYVSLKVVVPTNLSRKQRKLLRDVTQAD